MFVLSLENAVVLCALVLFVLIACVLITSFGCNSYWSHRIELSFPQDTFLNTITIETKSKSAQLPIILRESSNLQSMLHRLNLTDQFRDAFIYSSLAGVALSEYTKGDLRVSLFRVNSTNGISIVGHAPTPFRVKLQYPLVKNNRDRAKEVEVHGNVNLVLMSDRILLPQHAPLRSLSGGNEYISVRNGKSYRITQDEIALLRANLPENGVNYEYLSAQIICMAIDYELQCARLPIYDGVTCLSWRKRPFTNGKSVSTYIRRFMRECAMSRRTGFYLPGFTYFGSRTARTILTCDNNVSAMPPYIFSTHARKTSLIVPSLRFC